MNNDTNHAPLTAAQWSAVLDAYKAQAHQDIENARMKTREAYDAYYSTPTADTARAADKARAIARGMFDAYQSTSEWMHNQQMNAIRQEAALNLN